MSAFAALRWWTEVVSAIHVIWKTMIWYMTHDERVGTQWIQQYHFTQISVVSLHFFYVPLIPREHRNNVIRDRLKPEQLHNPDWRPAIALIRSRGMLLKRAFSCCVTVLPEHQCVFWNYAEVCAPFVHKPSTLPAPSPPPGHPCWLHQIRANWHHVLSVQFIIHPHPFIRSNVRDHWVEVRCTRSTEAQKHLHTLICACVVYLWPSGCWTDVLWTLSLAVWPSFKG